MSDPSSRLSRRGLLAALSGLAFPRPALSRAADRPLITHGIQSGDVGGGGAVLWARADRPCRSIFELSTTPSFRELLQGATAEARPDTDGTAKVALQRLPAGQDLFYRVRLEDLAHPTVRGEQAVGRFRTPSSERRSVSFCWSGDTAGQGWGIDPSRGGMAACRAVAALAPDFFIHSGDMIYADAPIPPEIPLRDGTVWRNLVTPEVAAAAQSLDEFRGRYKYNLLDDNLRAMNAVVPILAQWDDHEVTNNWWPGQPLTGSSHRRLGYTVADATELARRGSRAFQEYTPMRFEPAEPGRVYRKVSYGPLLDVFMLDLRSYRGPNGPNREPELGPTSRILGPVQLAWLKRELRASRATWKVIASDQPIGVVVHDDFATRSGSEGIAQENGPPLGRELEIADLLGFLRRERVRNMVWVTADVHYTAAHYYDPNRARFQDFDPFWEFVSGPLHAGTFAPGELDDSFGPQLRFAKGPTPEQGQNLSPAAGLQFFGHVTIEGATGQMTVRLKDSANATLWSTTLDPEDA